jgi:two-component system, chemotaxis family, response regulator Rcp1
MNQPLDGSRPAEVLLVEDNLSDVILTREGFERGGVKVNLHHVEDGEECLAFLRREGRHAAAPVPDLVLLDLNLPRMDGREVLSELVADERLRHMPVVVLSTSASELDIHRMYALRCSSYIVKPVDFDEFQRVVQGIGDYWFNLIVLPSRG